MKINSKNRYSSSLAGFGGSLGALARTRSNWSWMSLMSNSVWMRLRWPPPFGKNINVGYSARFNPRQRWAELAQSTFANKTVSLYLNKKLITMALDKCLPLWKQADSKARIVCKACTNWHKNRSKHVSLLDCEHSECNWRYSSEARHLRLVRSDWARTIRSE